MSRAENDLFIPPDDLPKEFHIFMASRAWGQTINSWRETYYYNIIRWYINGFLLVFGLVSNLTCFTILQVGRLRQSPTRLFLSAFSICDISVLLFTLLPMFVGDYSQKYFVDADTPCKIMTYLQAITLFMNPWMTVLVTMERAGAIYFPLKAKGVTGKMKMSMILGLIGFWTISCLYFPLLMEAPTYTGDIKEGAIFNLLVLRKLGLASTCVMQPSSSKLAVIQPIVLPIFHFFIPFLLILVGNVVILYEIKRGTRILAAAYAGQMNVERVRRERAATITVCAAGFTYLLLMVPGSIYTLAIGYFRNEMDRWLDPYGVLRKQMFHLMLSYACFTCYFFNSSINFTVYLLTGGSFRKQVSGSVKMLLCSLSSRNSE